MNNEIRKLFEFELQESRNNPILFKNEFVFSKNYIPQSVRFRKRQLQDLMIKFRKIYHIKESNFDYFQAVTLVGPIASGKSLVARLFCSNLVDTLNIKYSKMTFIYRHINCRRNKSVFTLLFDLIRSIIPNFPNRGFSSSELLNMLHVLLTNSRIYLFLILDEIDYLFKDKEIKLFFENLTFNSGLERDEHKKISLIYITRNRNFLLLLDPENKFRIIENIIRFEEYNKHEITEILVQRVASGLKDGIISFDSIEYIAELAFKSVRIRYAIELLWRCVKIAESKKSLKVKKEHINLAYRLINDQ